MGRNAKPIKAVRPDAAKDRRFVTALARGLDVLGCFLPSEQWLPNQEIARRTGLPKATVSRLTFTLTSLGYLRHSPALEMYSLGLPVLALGFRVLSHFDVGRIARPFMQAMADEAQAAVSLGIRQGGWVVYVAHTRSSSPLTLGLDVGARLPLMRSVIGRALLFDLDAAAQEKAQALVKAEAPSDWASAQETLASARTQFSQQGYVVSPPGAVIGAVATTFNLGDGRESFGLNCGGPANLMTQERLLELGPKMLAMARAIRNAIRSEE